MTSVRLIATDLDGTVLRTGGAVSERTVRAVAAEDAGLMIIVATGRPPRFAERFPVSRSR